MKPSTRNHLVSALLCGIFFLASGQTSESSPDTQSIASDTGRVSLLIDKGYASEDARERLDYFKQAYELSKSVDSDAHQSRAAIVYGSFLAEINLDSGIALIDEAIARYEKNSQYYLLSNAYHTKGDAYFFENELEAAIPFYKKAWELAKELKKQKEIGNAAFALSDIYTTMGDGGEGLEWAYRARDAYQALGNTQWVSDTYNQIGIVYDQQGLYAEAIENYLIAKDYALEVDYIEGIIMINNNIGVIYDNMNNTPKALEYFNDALEQSRIHDLKDDEATLLNNLADISKVKGDSSRAIRLLKQALAIELSENYDCFASYPLEALGSIYVSTGKLDSANILLESALKVAQECDEAAMLTTIHKSLGQLYLKQRQFSKAFTSFRQALNIAEDKNLPPEIKDALLSLYQYHDRRNQPELALQYLARYQSYSDSLQKVTNLEKAASIAADYEFRQAVLDIQHQQANAQRDFDKQIASKTITNTIILVIAGVLLVVAVVFIRGYLFIKKNNQKLELLNEEKNKLIGVVAHDLRNPLNLINGLLPLMSESIHEVKNPHYPQYIEMFSQSSAKMISMIDRILDISAIENMKLNLNMEKSNLNHLVYISIENFSLIASKKDIKIVNHIDLNVSHISLVDPKYLEQVIDNLISNAIKFSESGKQITISLVTKEDKNLIEVKDEGPGISKEDQENLYQAFKTTSSKPTGQESSTGLGLSIAYKFVEAMHGEIAIESELGKGTSFIVSFDVAS